MDERVSIDFSIKRYLSSKDKDFVKALMIYNATIPADTKTSSNEILYFVDHYADYPNREMFFFGLYADGHIIGFLEAGYLVTTKTIIIDYIVLKDEFRLNSVFYPLFSLVQKYFSEHMIDYDYIVTEVSTKCPEESVDSESFFSKKMLQMEDFRIVEALYRQPKLGLDNLESNYDFQLMIKSAQALVKLKPQTYLAIVRDIYYEHYYPWYAVSDFARSDAYKDHLDSEFTRVKEYVDKIEGEIQLTVQAPSCHFYKAPDCHYGRSTAGFATGLPVKRRKTLLLWIPIITLCALAVSLTIYYLLVYLDVSYENFGGIFSAITAIFTSLVALIFGKIAKN